MGHLVRVVFLDGTILLLGVSLKENDILLWSLEFLKYLLYEFVRPFGIEYTGCS